MTIKNGIYPVIHTPLLEDESIDFKGFDKCLGYYLGTDIHGLTILGSGGELPYFSDQEQLKIVQYTYSKVQNKKPLIIGVNAYSSAQAIEKITAYKGYSSYILLLLTPYYKSSFENYLKAIENIAQHSTSPILFYYFPQITGHYFSNQQLIKLLCIKNIIGIKDSSLHLATARTVLNKLPDTRYFSGLTLVYEHIAAHGAAGAICPIATILPMQAAAFFEDLNLNNTKEINKRRTVLKSVLPIANNLNISVSVQNSLLNILIRSPKPLIKSVTSPHANIKEALSLLGLPIHATVRSPLAPINYESKEKIAKILASIKI